jgi:hypothetical protein
MLGILLEQRPFGANGSLLGQVLSVLIFASFIALYFFGQKIQSRIALLEIDSALKRLEFMKSEAHRLALKTIREIGKPQHDPSAGLEALIEQFIITPVDLDPTGIISKLDLLLDVRQTKLEGDVKVLAPAANETQIRTLGNLVEATSALNQLFKIVRHFYLFGKKTSSFFMIMQLQMLLPSIMQIAEAYSGAVRAFAEGHPIGDGAGALVASKLMVGKEKRRIEKDIVVAETTIEGRRVLVMKAEGPGGNVGKPGEAIKQLIESNQGRVSLILMIDAAVKFEGEKSGDISEGIGAAIGGIGTERYKIEEEATKHKIPVYALIIKESLEEAIASMRKQIFDAADRVIERIRDVLLERTREGDLVIIAGIGNTIGIAQ